jgi:hypothetical protein
VGNKITKLSDEERKTLREERFKKPLEQAQDVATNGRVLVETVVGREATHDQKSGDQVLVAIQTGSPKNSRITADAPRKIPPLVEHNDIGNGETREDPNDRPVAEKDTDSMADASKPSSSQQQQQPQKRISIPPPSLPSPFSSKDHGSERKRKRTGGDEHIGQSPKKRRIQDVEASNKPVEQVKPEHSLKAEPGGDLKALFDQATPRENQKLPIISLNNMQRVTPVEPNPECVLDLQRYDDDASVPLLYSSLIEHKYNPTELDSSIRWAEDRLPEKFLIELRQGALALYRDGITSRDLGRKYATKKGPSRVINDVDLYFRGSKVHVATDRGLLLASDYLKLIGVPDHEAVHFKGEKPMWAKGIEAKRHYRRVDEPFLVDKVGEEQGLLNIVSGSTVMVYEVGVYNTLKEVGGQLVHLDSNLEKFDATITKVPSVLAYGMRLHDCAKGWFPYDHTCRLDWGRDTPRELEPGTTKDPNVIDWSKFKYACLATMIETTPHATSSAIKVSNDSQAASRPGTQSPQASAISHSVTPMAIASTIKLTTTHTTRADSAVTEQSDMVELQEAATEPAKGTTVENEIVTQNSTERSTIAGALQDIENLVDTEQTSDTTNMSLSSRAETGFHIQLPVEALSPIEKPKAAAQHDGHGPDSKENDAVASRSDTDTLVKANDDNETPSKGENEVKQTSAAQAPSVPQKEVQSPPRIVMQQEKVIACPKSMLRHQMTPSPQHVANKAPPSRYEEEDQIDYDDD